MTPATVAEGKGRLVDTARRDEGSKALPEPTDSCAVHPDDYVSALLTASRVLVGVSARSLSEVEDTVTLAQFRTLVVLDSRGGTNLSGLADTLGVNASTAMRTVDRLIGAGLVTREENPTSRREVVLAVTPAGASLVRTVTARRRDEIARIVGGMDGATQDLLVSALREFADAAGEPEARSSEAGW